MSTNLIDYFIKNKKLLLIVIILILVLSILKVAAMNDKYVKEKNINIALKVFKKDEVLDPSRICFTAEYFYLENLTAKLVGLDNSALYENQLAEEFKFENDKKDIYVKIKKAEFSDGTPITALDVVNTFKRVILRGSPHSDPKSFIRGAKNLKSLDQEIEGLKVIDERTLFIGLNNKMKELFYYLQLADYGILHPDQYKKEKLTTNDWIHYSSGPYKIYFDEHEGIHLVATNNSLFFHKDMPRIVTPVQINEDTLFEDLQKGRIHLGTIPLLSYVKNNEEFNNLNNVSFFGGVFNAIDYLALNVKLEKFKKQEVRQWIQKKIMKGFHIKDDQKRYMQKAYQYFLLGAKGYIPEADTISLLPDSIDLTIIPEEIKSGITLKSVPGMKKYLPDDFVTYLESVLGIQVKVDFSIPNDQFAEIVSKKEHEAILMATSMSYKVLGETLNLLYTSASAKASDPTGKIKELLNEYQKEDEPKKEEFLINKLLKQMIVDSEVIPLFYLVAPIFYNHDELDISEMNMEESMQFWRLRVKK